MQYNSNRMFQYVVQPNDSLYKIAKLFNTNVEDLKKVNHLVSNTIYPNQVLYIPTSTSNDNTYLTNTGDSIKDICNKFNLTLDDLCCHNDVDKLTLEGNQLLLVEKRHNHKEYEVKGDEKIEDILSKYNLSPLQFLKLNEKKILKPGEEIIVEE